MTPSADLGHVGFEVAGLVARVGCAWPKPILWITELHPAFASSRAHDLAIHVEYDDGYWARGLPWTGPDRLIDHPAYTATPGGGLITASYYAIEASPRRAEVRIASGFGVGGVMRALYAALLPARGACLLRARMRDVDDGVVLAPGDPDDGVVALIATPDGVAAEPTPFHAGTSPARAPRRLVRGVDVSDTGSAHGGHAAVAAALLENAVMIDHSPPTAERVVDIVTRLAMSVVLTTDAAAMRGARAAR